MGETPLERCYDCGQLIPEGLVARVDEGGGVLQAPRKVSVCAACKAKRERAEQECVAALKQGIIALVSAVLVLAVIGNITNFIFGENVALTVVGFCIVAFVVFAATGLGGERKPKAHHEDGA